MRTVQEIVDHIKEVQENDIFGYQVSDLLEFLPFDDAKQFLKPGVDEKKWSEHRKPLTDEEVKSQMKEYFPFAVDKATNHRGLSADRSIQHYEIWVWLLNDEGLQNELNDAPYTNYGAPKLLVIGRYLGLKGYGDEAFSNMARGLKCTPDCDMGCSK